MRQLLLIAALVLGVAQSAAAQTATWIYYVPVFNCAAPAKLELRPPKWLPNPALITSITLWSEPHFSSGISDYPSTMAGNITVAIDPGMQAAQTLGWPATENDEPLLNQALVSLKFAPGAAIQETHPFSYPAALYPGDGIMVSAECQDTASPQWPMFVTLAITWQASPLVDSGCGIQTRLMIDPQPTDGPVLSDTSLVGHQVSANDITVSNGWMQFDGATSYATVADGPPSAFSVGPPIFDWNFCNEVINAQGAKQCATPGDFTLDGWLETTDASLDTQNRHVISGGTTSTGMALIILPSGFLAFGNDETGAVVTGTTAVNDGNPHHFAVTRQSGTLRLFVDGVQEAATTDNTLYQSAGLTIGHYPGGAGHFHGGEKALRIIRGTALWTANFTPPSGPAC